MMGICDVGGGGALDVPGAKLNLLARDADAAARKPIKGGAFIDVKAAFGAAPLRAAGLAVWRL